MALPTPKLPDPTKSVRKAVKKAAEKVGSAAKTTIGEAAGGGSRKKAAAKVGSAVKATVEKVTKGGDRKVKLKDGTTVSVRERATMAKDKAESRQKEHVDSIEEGMKSGKFAFRDGPGTEIIMADEKAKLDAASKVADAGKRKAQILAINDKIRKRRLKDQASLKKSKKLK